MSNKEEINIFIKEFVDKYGENYKVILRRLQRELLLLDTMNIDYKLSVNPLIKKSLNRNNIVQIDFTYLDYHLYIFIPETYPFEQPFLMMDKLSINERKYRVQDGLKDTKIEFLHSIISDFAIDTKVDDLICIKEFVENKFVVPSNVKPSDIDPRRVYYMKFSKYFAPTVSLNDTYKVMIEGIHLALGIE